MGNQAMSGVKPGPVWSGIPPDRDRKTPCYRAGSDSSPAYVKGKPEQLARPGSGPFRTSTGRAAGL